MEEGRTLNLSNHQWQGQTAAAEIPDLGFFVNRKLKHLKGLPNVHCEDLRCQV